MKPTPSNPSLVAYLERLAEGSDEAPPVDLDASLVLVLEQLRVRRAALTALRAGCWWWADGLHVDADAARILGLGDTRALPPEEARALAHPDDAPKLAAAARATAEHGFFAFTCRVRTSRGFVPVHVTGRMRPPDTLGTAAAALVGTVRDLTIATGEADPPAVAEPAPQLLLAAVPDPIYRLDRHGNVLDCHLPTELARERYARLLASGPEALFSDEQLDRVRGVITRACDAPGTPHAVQLAMEGRHYQMHAVGLSSSECVLACRDVTAHKEHQDLLETARRRADSANRAKSSFLANMSHELRTPLNSIIGFSELLQQEHFGSLNERQRLYVDNVLHSGRHLLGLVNDILDLSKIEAGRMVVTREWVDVHDVLAACCRAVAPLAEQHQIRIVDAVPATLDPVFVDPVRIKQVLLNVLHNGIKFTAPGGRVVVSARQGDVEIAIEVTDTGRGIAPEEVVRIFDEFEQIGRPGHEAGWGLGLAVARRLVELHGGSITATSDLGVGTTFTIVLPSATQTPDYADRRMQGGEPVVLLVAGRHAPAELIARQLRCAGLGVAFAHTPEQALSIGNETGAIAVVLDLDLPPEDLTALVARLQGLQNLAGAPIVVVGEAEGPSPVILGVAEQLTRPVSGRALVAALNRHGVRSFRLDGVRVWCASSTATLDPMCDLLRDAGATVERGQLSPIGEPDLLVVDRANWDDTEAALEPLRGSAPALILVSRRETEAVDWPGRTAILSRTDAQKAPHRVVRTAHLLLDRGRTSTAPRLLSAVELRAALANQIARVTLKNEPLLVVSVRVVGEPPPDLAATLGSTLRGDDHVGWIAHDVLAVVPTRVTRDGGPRLRDRLVAALQAIGLGVSGSRIVHHPYDGSTVDGLLGLAAVPDA